MTDAELDRLEKRLSGPFKSPWRKEMYYEAVILELIAELRQAKKERDWLARELDFENCCVPSELKEIPGYCLEHECVECGLSSAGAWLDAAKEAVCQK